MFNVAPFNVFKGKYFSFIFECCEAKGNINTKEIFYDFYRNKNIRHITLKAKILTSLPYLSLTLDMSAMVHMSKNQPNN